MEVARQGRRTLWQMGYRCQMKYYSLIVLIVILIAVYGHAADPNVRIGCDGRLLVDGNGNEMMLRGIYARAAWLLDSGGEQDIISLKNFGCNFMRITVPFDPDYWNTVNGGVFDISKRGILREQDLSDMDQIASWCETNQMYFMLCQQPTYQGFDFDLLDHAPDDPDLYAQQMANVAAVFAQRYGHYDYLLGYEPFGEPHGIDTSSERAAYKQICTAYVDAIRLEDPNRIVSVAACEGYAHPSYFYTDTRIERANILYTFSYYPCRPFISYQPYYGDIRYPDDVPDFYRDQVIWLDHDWLWTYGMNDAVSWSTTWNVPVYCHEFGAWGYGQWDGSSPDNSSERYMRDMVQLFEDHTINWIIWRWQTNATDVPTWWKGLWAGQQNNRVVIEPHGGEFLASETVTMHTFVADASIYYTLDGSEPNVNSYLYSGGFDIFDDTTIKAKVIKDGLSNTPIDAASFQQGGSPDTAVINPTNGLRYWKYSGDWAMVPDFDSLQADSNGTCSNFSPYQDGFTSGKALLWKGYIHVPQAAVYYFNSRVDALGAMKLSIDDAQVMINGMNTGTGTTYSVGQMALEAGMHTIELGYTWPTGASSLFDLEIQRPSDTQFINIPGSILYYAQNPPQQAVALSPQDGQADVPINRDLRWKPGVDTVSHDLYFGKTNPPPFIGNQTGAMYETGIMDSNTIYYWRVDEKNSYGITMGNLWVFATGNKGYQIGWWKFDEMFGFEASDSSGSDNHGQLKEMASDDWIRGRNENALDFDGYDDYVWIPYDASLDVGTEDFSMSLWVKKDTIWTGNKYLYNQRLDGYNWFYLQFRSTAIIESVLKFSGTEVLVVRSATPLSAGTWYHIVLVVDRDSPAQTKIYINNADDTGATPTVNTGDYSLGTGATIGRWSGGGGENYDGIIDDFRFYSWALNAQEVQQLYDYGFLEGDINRNDMVDNLDYAVFADHWKNEDCMFPDWCGGADIDKKGWVDGIDLEMIANNWLNDLNE